MRRPLLVVLATLISAASAATACVSTENVTPGPLDAGGGADATTPTPRPDAAAPRDAADATLAQDAGDAAPRPDSGDATASDATVIDATASDATVIDATASDATVSDATASDATASDATVSDATASDATVIDATASDATVSDAAVDAMLDALAEAGAFTNGSSSNLRTARQSHTATLLNDGRLLVTGGWLPGFAGHVSAEVFSPDAGTFTALGGTMNVGRQNHVATLLAGGKVLITGGYGVPDGGTAGVLDSAEIFDPTTNTFTMVVARMTSARVYHDAARLADGRVLLVGGATNGSSGDVNLDTAEIFDPGSDPVLGTFTAVTARMASRRQSPTATALASGQVLVAGGRYGVGGSPQYTATADTFDPAVDGGVFSPTVNALGTARTVGTATRLANGQVLLVGGYAAAGTSAQVDLYDPGTRTFTASSLPEARAVHAAGLLPSGRVVLAGGVAPSITDTAVIYTPGAGFQALPVQLSAARGLLSGTTLADGRVLFAGGQLGTGFITTQVDLFRE